jgi:hypothetical protein
MTPNQQDILDEAVQAFWFIIATSHPEIKTGDFHPLDFVAFNISCEQAYKSWLASNQPFHLLLKKD